MKKKWFALILVLAMVLCQLPAVAAASETADEPVLADGTAGTINSVFPSVHPPVEGQKSREVGPDCLLFVDHFNIIDARWLYSPDEYTADVPDLTFVRGETYYIMLTFKADPGWYFQKGSVTYTGIDEGYQSFDGCTVGGGTCLFAASKTIDGVDYLRVKISVVARYKPGIIDEYVDNSVDNSRSYVKGEVYLTGNVGTALGYNPAKTVYEQQEAKVTYTNPRTANVQGMINAAYDRAKYLADQAKAQGTAGEFHMSTTSNSETWDSRVYNTVYMVTGAYNITDPVEVTPDPDDETLFRDAEGNEYYSDADQITRTQIVSGDYGRKTYYSVQATGWVEGEVAPVDPVVAFVTRLYNVCLNRDPDEGGLNDWVSQLKAKKITGIQAAYGFIFSQEFRNKNLCNRHFVQQMYNAFMGREPDESGWNNWIRQLESGKKREEVFNGFALSAEFNNLCTEYGITRGKGISVGKYGTVPKGECQAKGCGEEDGVTQFVKRLYQICLERQADAGGLTNWTNHLWNHTKSGKSVAFGFVFSAEFTNRHHSNEKFVDYMYLAFFGREADAAGKANWVKQLNAGKSRQDVFNGFADSAEFSNLCAKYGIAAR